MAPPQPVVPVKFLVAILWSDSERLADATQSLRERWGEFDFAGPDHPFDATDYYVSEMGVGAQRRLVSFRQLASPETLAEAKLVCNDIEDRWATPGGRRVNLDIGYLDLGKVVLASLKFAGQKIAIGQGVYADLIGRYGQGKYRPFEWTFPDFRDGRYDGDLSEIRRLYREQLRSREGR
ncbi:MAG: DUF4416 family protein [Pirellulales bacterium]